MAEADELTPGAVFGGYRIERLLGRGGMGAVYAAEQVENGRQVAVKVLKSGLGSTEDRERFLREGRIAASINHPNTVYVFGTEEIGGLQTITMELVDGGTLEEKVEQRGPLPVVEAIRDTLQIVDGLDAAHQLGILHRDIKPANCFVGPSGEVKVGDFGLSRPVDQVDQAKLTQTGLFLGTPVFSSPEQLMGETLDVRSDIYAVGATLYFLLSQKLPFNADNAVRLIAVVMSGAPTPLLSIRPDVPDAVNAAVMRCLARKREDRFPDYASLRAALRECLPEDAAPAPVLRRFTAGLVDSFASGLIVIQITVALTKLTGRDMSHATTDPLAQLQQAAGAIPVALLWYGLIEGRFGASPGKFALGLRVARTGGGPPGLARGAARALLVSSPALIAIAAMFAWPGQTAPVWLAPTVSFSMIFALFARARRANGWLGEHDRLTRTRVIAHTKALERTRVAYEPSASESAPTTTGERVGPFDVIARVASSADVIAGYDPQLRRSIWIVRQPPGTPPLPQRQRQMVRSTCLRWIGARRSATDAWDAYAAVAGTSLRERLTGGTSWPELHGWLSDIVDELQERDNPAAELASLSIDHVWIANDGRAILLPFAMGEAAATANGRTLLQQFVTAVGAADDRVLLNQGWPLRARRLLESMAGAVPDLDALSASLAKAGELTPMSRKRRLALWGAITGTILGFGVLAPLSANAGFKKEPEQLRMQPLLDYLGSKRNRADSLAAQRDLVATYVAGHFREAIARADRKAQTTTPIPWKRADSAVAAHPAVSPQQLAAADRLVDSTWHGVPPGEIRADRLIIFLVSVGFVFMGAMFSAAAALFVRRGLPARILSLEIVNRRGKLAGRIRLVWRQLLIWAPICFLSVLPLAFLRGASLKGSAIAAAAVLFVIANIVTALRSPSRGLTEILSGTMIVPE